MNDPISRAKLFDELNRRGVPYNAEVNMVINGMPSAQQWIPCSERLPEETGKYLVTVQNGNVYAGTYDKYSGRFQCAATAWMELPAPYQEDD